jgi:DNA-binding response OmpR family regulator
MRGMGATPLRILLVEDDEDNRDLLAEFLRMEGHVVEPFCDAEQALAAASQARFDAVVADLGLPRMDGLELARELRRLDPRLAVVVVSGWGDGPGIAEARGRDVDAIVTKPADPQRLIAALSAAVRVRRALPPVP